MLRTVCGGNIFHTPILRFWAVRNYNRAFVEIDRTVLFKAFSCHTITVQPHESLKQKRGVAE